MTRTNLELVQNFIRDIRSGQHLELVNDYLASEVTANQITAENPYTVIRTPANYAQHVAEMRESYGEFSLEIEECLCQDDRVYVRWRQTGTHVGPVDGFAPTGLPLYEAASAVYRIADDRIVEYWIQVDRLGVNLQLEQNQKQKKEIH